MRKISIWITLEKSREIGNSTPLEWFLTLLCQT